MTRPEPKGWCPDAYRMMESGDGWIVRIKPPFARLSVQQAGLMCDLSERFGNGVIDLTSRANLQLRGMARDAHAHCVSVLGAAGLLEADATTEARRNILIQPFWTPNDLTYRLSETLVQRLAALPALPSKFGFAIDTGPKPLLLGASADIRIEPGARGLIVRADGAPTGKLVTEGTAIDAAIALAHWFAETGGAANASRMAAHIRRALLPEAFLGADVRPAAPPVAPGETPLGRCVGLPFGTMRVDALRRLLEQTGAQGLRLLPGRLMVLEAATGATPRDFVDDRNDPLLSTHACPGAPFCASATVETRRIARRMARPGLHVSGCAKGCAYPRSAPITLVGRDGRYDLVRNGAPWEEAERRGLSAAGIKEVLT